MATINLSKPDLPFLLDGNGNITVGANIPNLNQPLPPEADELLSVAFGATGDQSFSFGKPGSLKLGIGVGAKAQLLALRKDASGPHGALLEEYKLASYFDDHPDDLILALVLGANADASVAGSFRYEFLKATAKLEAGTDAGYAYLCNFPADTHADQMLPAFFAGMRLPAHVTAAPKAGEVIAFNYGGYLKFGAGLSAGYEIKGTPSLNLGELELSEHYQLSVIGKLALSASIAGHFAVEVRADETPGWARVIVRKHRASAFKIAADVNVNADISTEGLPETPNELLGALFGVNVKNWLNVVEQVQKFTDFDQLNQELDSLAKRFISEWTGKAFDELEQTGIGAVLTKIEDVVNSYHNLENRAISLFDRYFNKLDVLTDKLNELINLTSWNQFKGEVHPLLWDIVSQLTDGDPLTWALGKINTETGQEIPSLPELQRRAQQTLDLIQDQAHQQLRDFIQLGKGFFPLHHFLVELGKVDSIAELNALTNQKLGGFVERLLGKGIGELSNSEAGKFVTQIHTLLANAEQFEQRIFDKFKAATKNSFSFQFHAEYSRASERDALIDLAINLEIAEGKELMRLAGEGDFAEALASFRPDLVRINRGRLTHRVTKQSKFSVNVVGWHGGKQGAWHYQGLDRLILNTEQQIETAENGRLNVFTTIDLTKEKERKRQGERMYTNFLFRFIGESRGVLKFDARNQQYLIDTITGLAAKYKLSFDDPKTSRDELAYYLSFADEFGLADEGATLKDLLPLLKADANGNFGEVTVEYEARYTEDGLRALFKEPFDAKAEDEVRQIMRRIVLANYVRDEGLKGLGWCYWTPGVFALRKTEGFATFANLPARSFSPIAAAPTALLTAPNSVTLQQHQLRVLNTLYNIENSFVAAARKLSDLVQSNQQTSPKQFEDALGDIGDALKLFDDFDLGDNTVFAVLDQLVRLETPPNQARASSLTLVSKLADDQEFSKRFIAQPEGLELVG